MLGRLTLALSLPVRAEIAAQQLATGQLVTPTALPGAVQQLLNPGLPNYPNFIAGEAVRSQLSPDGKTLAVLCAGMNSLDKPDGTTDVPNSTQYIFVYDVSGRPDGKFIFVSLASGDGGYLDIWGARGGTAGYRHSPPFFARKKLPTLDQAGGMEYFAGFDGK